MPHVTPKRAFDERFATEVLAAVRGLAVAAVPRWGSMTGRELTGHLLASLRYSMGEVPFDVPPQVPPWRGRILRWLFLDLGLSMPRHVRFRSHDGDVVPLATVDGGIDDLGQVLLRVAHAGPADIPRPAPHPYFGVLTWLQWKAFHVRHIDHHLSQFGIKH